MGSYTRRTNKRKLSVKRRSIKFWTLPKPVVPLVALSTIYLTLSKIEAKPPPPTHLWKHYVGSSRHGHNLGIDLGYTSGSWTVQGFATREEQKYNNSGISIVGSYNYHIPIAYSGLGYTVGSSFGYYINDIGTRSDFSCGDSFLIPGLRTGLTFDFNSRLRVLGFGHIYLVRHEWMTHYAQVNRTYSRLSATLVAISAGVYVDYFLRIQWGLRAAMVHRNLWYYQPDRAQGKIEGANIKATDTQFSLGVVYHIL